PSASLFRHELREERISSPNNLAFQLEHFFENLGWRVVILGFSGDGFVAPCGKAPVVLANLLDGHTVAVISLLLCWPLREHIGKVVRSNRHALVVETEAVGRDVIEPY